MWCNQEQEESLEKVMRGHFEQVERHYWWNAGVERKQNFKLTRTVPTDVKIGFVGYCNTEETERNDVSKRSRMVVAPGDQAFQSGQVAREFFEQHSTADDVVGDIFCGNGSGAVAAATIGRSSVSVDMQDAKVSFTYMSMLVNIYLSSRQRSVKKIITGYVNQLQISLARCEIGMTVLFCINIKINGWTISIYTFYPLFLVFIQEKSYITYRIQITLAINEIDFHFT